MAPPKAARSVGQRADTKIYRRHIKDTGVGISRDKLETVFEPFVQANSPLSGSTRGTGLGLAISRQLARAMGGDLKAESEVGQGSTFTQELPRADGKSSETRKSSETNSDTMIAAERVLTP